MSGEGLSQHDGAAAKDVNGGVTGLFAGFHGVQQSLGQAAMPCATPVDTSMQAVPSEQQREPDKRERRKAGRGACGRDGIEHAAGFLPWGSVQAVPHRS